MYLELNWRQLDIQVFFQFFSTSYFSVGRTGTVEIMSADAAAAEAYSGPYLSMIFPRDMCDITHSKKGERAWRAHSSHADGSLSYSSLLEDTLTLAKGQGVIFISERG